MAELSELSPEAVLKQVADALPEEARGNVIIVGSLAAAYWLFRGKGAYGIRTKDVDSVLSPHFAAVEKGMKIAANLLSAGWKPKTDGEFGKPGTKATPDQQLPAMRLYPPTGGGWFFELLTEPLSENQTTRTFTRFSVGGVGDYGLPSFPFTGIATFDAKETEFLIRCARPEMMALANMLEHAEIGPDLVKDTGLRRSNKDLGRAIAILRLSDMREAEDWPRAWLHAIQDRFPSRWRELASRAGQGVRALIASEPDVSEAVVMCNSGLLARNRVDPVQLRATGRQLLALTERLRG